MWQDPLKPQIGALTHAAASRSGCAKSKKNSRKVQEQIGKTVLQLRGDLQNVKDRISAQTAVVALAKHTNQVESLLWPFE
jgi:predicted  nucleic acid-binding Zn-ribbon protein